MMAEVQVRIEPPTGTPRSFAIESTTREGIIEAKSTLRAKGDRHVQQLEPSKRDTVVYILLLFTNIQELLETVESKVIHAYDEKAALDYRSTQMEQCSMTGVAGALVAQIASSSLQLEYMKTIRPIVPALCTSSLVIALFCVYYSFRMHYLLAKCTCAEDLITAFTQRAPVGTEGGSEEGGPGGGEIEPGSGEAREACVVREGEEEVQGRGGGDEGGEEAEATDRRLEEGILGPMEEGGKREIAEGGEKSVAERGEKSVAERREKRVISSLAVLKLWLPFYLLKLALLLYLATVYLYWVIASKMDLEGRRKQSNWVICITALVMTVAGYQGLAVYWGISRWMLL